VVTSHHSYPSQVLGIDLEDGPRVLLNYWHMGNVQAIAVPDRDGNGADEIVVYGQDNNDHTSAVVILEPTPGELLRGRAPNGRRRKTLRIVEEYPTTGLTIRLPQTDLFRIESGAERDIVKEVSWDPETQTLSLTVKDSAWDSVRQLAMMLTYHLSLLSGEVEVEFNDHDVYLRMLKDAIRRGLIEDCCAITSTDKLVEYGRHLASRVQILDASEF